MAEHGHVYVGMVGTSVSATGPQPSASASAVRSVPAPSVTVTRSASGKLRLVRHTRRLHDRAHPTGGHSEAFSECTARVGALAVPATASLPTSGGRQARVMLSGRDR